MDDIKIGRGQMQGTPTTGGAKRVLLIDVDSDFADTAKTILDCSSMQVVRASSCSEAWLLAESEPPDAIIMEVMLPEGTDGFHFTWRLRQHQDPRLRDVPVIIVSRLHGAIPFRMNPLDSDWEYGPGEFLPVQGFLDKPVDPEELLEQVRGVLG